MPDGLCKVGWESAPCNQTDCQTEFSGGFYSCDDQGQTGVCYLWYQVTMQSFLELYVLVTFKGEQEYVVSLQTLDLK